MPKSKKPNIQPVPGYLLIKPKKQEKTTASGIVLPDSHEDKPQEGEVLAVGGPIFDDGAKIAAPVNIGDVVIYREWGGKEYKVDDVDYLILKFEDIMAILK